MSTRLPEFSDPRRLAATKKRFSGRLALRDLHRLAGELADTQGEVDYELRFSLAQQEQVRIDGRVRATLPLQCQRCLAAFPYEVDQRLALVLVDGLDEARRLPEDRDPVLSQQTPLRLGELLEDELLLALPQVPMHDSAAQCGIEQDSETSAVAGDNPFAVLTGWKDKSR